jgi:hypothetical protein
MGYLSNIYKKRERKYKRLYLGDLVSFEGGDKKEVVGICKHDEFFKVMHKYLGTPNCYDKAMGETNSFPYVEISKRKDNGDFCLIYKSKMGDNCWNRFNWSIKIMKIGE